MAAMTESLTDGVTLGIYEKALVSNPLATDDDWRRFLNQVPEAGFSFVDLSVDESEERMARLGWDQRRRRMVRHCVEATETAIGGVCLSVHRRIGLVVPTQPCASELGR
ncbi:L-xylulose 5-phosphate 3-epimerase [Cutibacterium acnes JCM 18918]|nr:L-xylulose 5-phosphate 3-epimerase [Cutibacterium acnes JCM 18918]